MKKLTIPNCRFSLWNELHAMLYLVSHTIADSFSFSLNMVTIADLSVYCANPKRKRQPKLWAFVNAA